VSRTSLETDREERQRLVSDVRRVLNFLASRAAILASVCSKQDACKDAIERLAHSLGDLSRDLGARPSTPCTALVLCGGGARGAAEVGLYSALQELKVPIDLVVGSSVGAIVGGFIASGLDARKLSDLWACVSEKWSLRPRRDLLWKGARSPALLDPSPLAKLLELHLPVKRFEDLATQLAVVATDTYSGKGVVLDRGELLPALLASSAIPGLFPPVELDGRLLMDGSLSHHLPLDVAIERGASRAIAVRCTKLRGGPVSGARDLVSRALQILLERQLAMSVELARGKAELWGLEPCYDEPVGLLDFKASLPLIECVRREAKKKLATLAKV